MVSFCLSVCLSSFLPSLLSFFLSFFLSFSLSLSLFLFIYFFLSRSFPFFLSLSLSLSFSLSGCDKAPSRRPSQVVQLRPRHVGNGSVHWCSGSVQSSIHLQAAWEQSGPLAQVSGNSSLSLSPSLSLSLSLSLSAWRKRSQRRQLLQDECHSLRLLLLLRSRPKELAYVTSGRILQILCWPPLCSTASPQGRENHINLASPQGRSAYRIHPHRPS